MSRRMIALVAVFFGALVVTNIVVLALWLPNRKNTTTRPAAAQAVAAPTPATVAQSNPAGPAPAAINAQPNNSAGGFAVERQVPSASGNLKLDYLRDRQTKMRRIAVEDAHQPGAVTVLCESKRSAWAIISPDDQWIAVEQRGSNGDGAVLLFHRSNASPAQFAAVQEAGGANLQDTVWKAYLAASQTDPATSRRGVTIDANTWDDSSHKLNLSVVYLAGQNNPEVPPPWSCTYDVTSKRVEPLPQPDAAGDQSDNGNEQQNSTTVASENPFPGNAGDAAPAEGEAEELPGEKFPATRLDQLEAADVNESSLNDINYAINEMYARHGVDFKDKKVSGQFSNFSWYKVRAGLTFADAETEFDDLEKQNLKVLRQCREAKGAVAHHRSASHVEKAPEESTGDKILRGIKTWQDMGAPMPPHP